MVAHQFIFTGKYGCLNLISLKVYVLGKVDIFLKSKTYERPSRQCVCLCLNDYVKSGLVASSLLLKNRLDVEYSSTEGGDNG